MNFVETRHCLSGSHCRTCRAKETGSLFRQRIRLAFEVPGDVDDFECPHGVPWQFDGDYRGLGDVVKKVLDKVVPRKYTGCGGCSKRQAILNKRFPFHKAKESTT